jgi:hypothetical protein
VVSTDDILTGLTHVLTDEDDVRLWRALLAVLVIDVDAVVASDPSEDDVLVELGSSSHWLRNRREARAVLGLSLDGRRLEARRRQSPSVAMNAVLCEAPTSGSRRASRPSSVAFEEWVGVLAPPLGPDGASMEDVDTNCNVEMLRRGDVCSVEHHAHPVRDEVPHERQDRRPAGIDDRQDRRPA